MVCRCKDCWHQALRGLPPPIRPRFHFGDAYQSVWAWRQLHPEHSHVVAALIRRFHEAKLKNTSTVVVWGTGTPRREFLYVDDFADASVFALKNYSGSQFINIGFGEEVTVAGFALTVAEIIGFKGKIVYDTSKPDGAPRKLLDVSRLYAMGWEAKVSLQEGLAKTYADFLTHRHESGDGKRRIMSFRANVLACQASSNSHPG